MKNILSDEELNALLALFHNEGVESQADRAAGPLPVEDKLHRRFFRLDQRLTARLQTDGKSYPVVATNISLGGIFACSEIELAIEQPVTLRIELPKPRAVVQVSGQVCWRKRIDNQTAGVGIRFSALPPEAIWAIIANIEHARKQKGILD